MKNKTNVKAGSMKANKTGSWRTYKPIVDKEKCIACGICVKVCPEGTVAMISKGQKNKAQINYDYCKGCGICAAECPVKAIKMILDKK